MALLRAETPDLAPRVGEPGNDQEVHRGDDDPRRSEKPGKERDEHGRQRDVLRDAAGFVRENLLVVVHVHRERVQVIARAPFGKARKGDLLDLLAEIDPDASAYLSAADLSLEVAVPVHDETDREHRRDRRRHGESRRHRERPLKNAPYHEVDEGEVAPIEHSVRHHAGNVNGKTSVLREDARGIPPRRRILTRHRYAPFLEPAPAPSAELLVEPASPPPELSSSEASAHPKLTLRASS